MQSNWMERLERLEVRVTDLERLPERIEQVEHRLGGVETQVLQLREEMAVEFSAVRQEIKSEVKACKDELRGEIQACKDELRGEIQACKNELRAEIDTVSRTMIAGFQQVHEVIEEKWRHTLVLHEDLVGRIKTLGEHFGSSR